MRTMKNLALAAMAAAALTLAGCGGGGGGSAQAPGPTPTPYQTALTAIQSAETAADAQAAYDEVKDDVTAAEGDELQDAVDARVETLAAADREMEQKAALMTAAGMVDTSGLSTAEAVAAANLAIAGLQEALDAAEDVSDADKAMYQSQLDAARMAVQTAQAALDTEDRRTVQDMALSDASTALGTALDALSSPPTQAEIDAAQAALDNLNTAIEAAEDLDGAEKLAANRAASNAEGRITGAKAALMAANEAAEQERLRLAEEAARMAAAQGKALLGALGGTPLDNNEVPVTLSAAGLAVTPSTVRIPGATAETLEAGDSAGSLGIWAGTEYAHTNSDGTVAFSAIVYTNQDAPKTMPFAEKYGDRTGIRYEADELTLTFGPATGASANDPGPDPNIDADSFPTSGPTTFDGAQDFRGTYDGAAGSYECQANCTATYTTGGIDLGAGWSFVHDSGAMTSTADADYTYFGWWLRSDGDGMPTLASAFHNRRGADLRADPGGSIQGAATYAGKAAGQYALSNLLDGTGEAGHFTADATLNARFGTDADLNPGVTGTIDNFMADGESKPWSVALRRGAFGGNGAIDAPAGGGTVWSINGTAAPRSGTWNGQMYKATADPANTTPEVVTGAFASEFQGVGRMVGAFGATKQ